MNTPFEPHSGGWSGVPVLPPASATLLEPGGGLIPDVSGWIEPFFPQPGEVRKPTKGNPVPAPGNPEGQVSGVQSAIVGALKMFVPSRQQMRDVLVYGGAAVLVGIAVWRAI